MRFYFVRHGESQANVERVISNRGLDHPLTSRGMQQAADLARALRAEAISSIATSPVLRARQTASVVGEALGLTVSIEHALCEFDCGVMEGRGDQEAWDAWAQVVHDWISEGKWDARIEGGESFSDMRERFVPYIWGLLSAHRATDHRICLVGHGGLYIHMLPLVMVNVDFDLARSLHVPYTTPIVAEPLPEAQSGDEKGGFLACRSWGEVVLPGSSVKGV